MGTARREVDDLLLVQAKYRMDALADQQCQMSERAESAVGHQHIAALQQGNNLPTPAMSCDRNGAAKTSSSSPVPAWNNARMWATGKP